MYLGYFILYIGINGTLHTDIPNMITVDRLRYFLVAAKLQHVGLAAKNLHVSPSVISSAIKSIEDSIGEILFSREKNRIKLNHAGNDFLAFAKKIIEDVDSLHQGSWRNKDSLTGHIRLGASHFLMQEFLIPAALEVQNNHKQITIEFVSLDSGIAVSHIRSGLLDAALIFRSSYFEQLNETVLLRDEFKVFVAKNHPILNTNKSRTVQKINELPAVTFRTSAGANFWENHPCFAEHGLIPNHRLFYDDTASCIQMLQKTGGWAFLPSVIGRKCRLISEVSFPKKMSAPVNVSMISNKSLDASSIVSLVLTQLTRQINSLA
jgi:DNA-binding transcriptional LysR family regulator